MPEVSPEVRAHRQGTGDAQMNPHDGYDPTNEELDEWLTILEGSLAGKFGITPRKLGLGTWTRLCGRFANQVITSGKPNTLAALHWLDHWVKCYQRATAP